MVVEDRIIKDMVYEYEGVFDFAEVLEIMNDWLARDRYDYKIKEKLHSESTKNDKKNVTIKWACEKKVDDYHKFVIKLGIDLKDATEKKGKVEGKFKIKINSILERDYFDVWGQSAWQRVLRSFIDKFIEGEREDKIASKLISETNSFLATVKRYFKGK